MSIDELIKSHITALDKNTAQLGEVLAALQGNTTTMTTLIEGRQEALEALTAKDAPAAKPARRTSKKKDDAETDTAEDETETKQPETVAAAFKPDISEDGLRALAVGYLTGGDDKGKADRVSNVQAMLQHFGAESINPVEGKKSLDGDDVRTQAAFFLTRYAAGEKVDFKADYDFGADPLGQSGATAAAADDDMVG